MPIKIYRTRYGSFAQKENSWFHLPDRDWAELSTRDNLYSHVESQISRLLPAEEPAAHTWLAPIAQQEVWAAGVTYFRSRTARMEESKAAGGGSFYDRVYDAERPELFFKATPNRVVGPGGQVHIRKDSKWNVPEPELTLLVSPRGTLSGYTIGNDMSSRDIEGENPLYLPQAKVYERSCALGPAILLTPQPLGTDAAIQLDIIRNGKSAFSDTTTLAQLKRKPESLVEFLFRENSFPNGAFLLTGTGIIPPDSFTLEAGDEIRIDIDGIGTLINSVD